MKTFWRMSLIGGSALAAFLGAFAFYHEDYAQAAAWFALISAARE